ELFTMLDHLVGLLERALNSQVTGTKTLQVQKPDRDFRVRRLWRDVLDSVDRLERTHAAVVLTGTYTAEPLTGGEPIRIAVVAIRSRRRNPAATKITTLWADAKVDERQMLADYFEGLD
ncbi:hypothetical protein ACETPF_19900, partial [Sphingobium sp. sgz301304]